MACNCLAVADNLQKERWLNTMLASMQQELHIPQRCSSLLAGCQHGIAKNTSTCKRPHVEASLADIAE
jgi:hypothetical protein